MPVKVDFKKSMKEYYQPKPNEVVLVNVPEMQFLMINGMGSPGDSKEYQDALAALYPISFKTKFLSKANGKDYVVPPLEGLWWADNMDDFIEGNRDKWKWTMMIMQPDWITQDMINEAITITEEKKPELSNLISKLRLEKYNEGKAAQIMHIGPYSEEGPTVQKVHDFIQKEGGKFDGQKNKHHEIYLSDPRKANPATMKTVIRQSFI
ncbi:MAG: GyrI-like domain-containing protein [Candidatus Lokiarchaeota archaeon]|nr:GyrI-like domain-containing protein [Candidatus Lokiarchaeota archaeon]